MALEIRGNQFEHTHENRAFREIARQLKALFNDQGWNGLLLGNPYCENNPNLQPDFLLYGPEFCIIFEMKDYEGIIQIPSEDKFETAPWKVKGHDEGLTVKGGSHVNPFVQLKKQRNQALSLLRKEAGKSKNTFDDVNVSHLQKAVLFNNKIEIEGSIPGAYNRNFFITDEVSLAEQLIDIKSDFGFRLEWVEILKSIFRANPYDLEIQLPTLDTRDRNQELKDWNREEQVFQNVYDFIEDDERNIHIVQGPINSGKLSLAHSLKEFLLSQGKVSTVEVLTLSKRVATFLNKLYPELTINSLHSTIYGGQSEVVEKKLDEDLMEKIEVIPIRSQPQDPQGNTLYIILESNRISNNYQEFTLTRFGSGHLIDDLLEFLDLPDSNSKLLLIGDQYQISYGKWEEAALNSGFLAEKTETKVQVDNIQPVVEELDEQDRSRQLLRIPPKIDEGFYNELWFENSSNLEIVGSNESIPVKLKEWHENHEEFIMLTYKNENAKELNRWFKTKILKKENDLDPGDRLLLHKDCKVSTEDPFSKPKILPNGSFVTIDEVGGIEPYTTTPRGQGKVKLKFRRLKVIPESEQESVEVYMLENYRESLRGELSKEEAIAFKILLNKKIEAKKVETPFEQSDIYNWFSDDIKTRSLKESIKKLEDKEVLGGKDEEELDQLNKQLEDHEKDFRNKYQWILKKEILDNDPLINALHAKHGWAMTVHKALGGKWDRVFLNSNRGANQGIANKNYFKWIYSGLSRAKENAVVVNFESISPFSICSFNSALPQQVYSEPSSKINLERILQNDSFAVPDDFIEKYFSDKEFSEIIKRYTYYLADEFRSQGWKIDGIDTSSDYIIKVDASKDDTETKIVFNYKKGQKVKNKARIEHIKNGDKEDVLNEISFIPDQDSYGLKLLGDFRRAYYEDWIEKLRVEGFRVKKINPLNYQDRFTIQKDDNWLSFNVYYDGKGFFSKIEATRSTLPEMWESVLSIIKPQDDEQV